jgi:hypothetical protein
MSTNYTCLYGYGIIFQKNIHIAEKICSLGKRYRQSPEDYHYTINKKNIILRSNNNYDENNNIIGKTLWIKYSLKKISNLKTVYITPYEIEPEEDPTNCLWIDMFDQFLEFLQKTYKIDLSEYSPGFYYYSFYKTPFEHTNIESPTTWKALF